MKSFSSLAFGFLALFTAISIGITVQLKTLPLTLTLVSEKPDLIVLETNRPIESIKSAFINGSQAKTFLASNKIYIQPNKILPEGEPQKVRLKNIKDSFQKSYTKELTITPQNAPLYYINKNGQLASYIPRTKQTKIVTPEQYFINEYNIGNNEIFFLGIEKNETKNESNNHQSLYHLDLTTNKITTISNKKRYSHQGLALSKDGKILAVYRGDLIEREAPILWLYDTQSKVWESYWKESFGAGNPVLFSPDNMWLLGVDLETQGFVLSPTQKGPAPIPIGNFDNSFGINHNGQYVLFRQWSENDIFSGKSFFSIFNASGESTQVLESLENTNIAAFHPKKNGFFFSYTPDNTSPQIGYFNINTNEWKPITSFTQSHNIIHIQPAKYTQYIAITEEIPRSLTNQTNKTTENIINTYFETAQNYTISLIHTDTGEKIFIGNGLLPKW